MRRHHGQKSPGIISSAETTKYQQVGPVCRRCCTSKKPPAQLANRRRQRQITRTRMNFATNETHRLTKPTRSIHQPIIPREHTPTTPGSGPSRFRIAHPTSFPRSSGQACGRAPAPCRCPAHPGSARCADKPAGAPCHAHRPVVHCEERSDVAISMRLRWAQHTTPANRRCYDGEIATLRSRPAFALGRACALRADDKVRTRKAHPDLAPPASRLLLPLRAFRIAHPTSEAWEGPPHLQMPCSSCSCVPILSLRSDVAISMRLNHGQPPFLALRSPARKAHPDLVEGLSTLAAGILPSPAGSEGGLKPFRHRVGAWQSLALPGVTRPVCIIWPPSTGSATFAANPHQREPD